MAKKDNDLVVILPKVRLQAIDHVPFVCGLCGEDRIHMFRKVRGQWKCRVCNNKATINEHALKLMEEKAGGGHVR